MINHKLPEGERDFLWHRWRGGICSFRELNITREMYYIQFKKGRWLEG